MRARGFLRCRLSNSRLLLLAVFLLTVVAYCYYYSSSAPPAHRQHSWPDSEAPEIQTTGLGALLKGVPPFFSDNPEKNTDIQQCAALRESTADIDTVKVYPNFDFQPSWMRTKEYWDKTFESRFEQLRKETGRPKLKVFVVPHSHNDPGWLKTFEGYFEAKTKHIINNMINKLTQYPNMTFMWTEMAFLNEWWESSHPTKQKALQRLIMDGRVEITTGGWVMPDEANTHLYALIDQFIEGHQWVKSNLGVSPKTGWSIDPFGHGPTVPYLLERSGLQGTIIQRIHYAWKRWFAEKQIEDFHWIPGWTTNKKPTMVVHNQPFDIYSIKASCGPHPSVCLSFDFRKIPGEYTEYSAKHEDITEANLHSKSKLLMEEYNRIGSLTTHNLVLVPLGDDFRYEHDIEFDSQYINYMKLFKYINSNQELFSAEVTFGTPLDYFKELVERQKVMPTLRGDFFVYSDIFSEGKPAYWSGYYTTRPYLKILARQLEYNLRTAEILFTLVSNRMRQDHRSEMTASEKRMEKYYEQLIKARRNLGLFQHHDAITGTSKANVMADYGTKLFTSLYHCVRIQETALSITMAQEMKKPSILQSELEWENYGNQPKKVKIYITDKKKIVLYNSLNDERIEVVTIRTNTSNVRVYDSFKSDYVLHQVNPNVDAKEDGRHVVSLDSYDILFVATLPPMTAVTYTIEEGMSQSHLSMIFCNNCNQTNTKSKFQIKDMMPGDIQLENSLMKLLINRNTGFLKQVYRKDTNKKHVCEMQFGAYQSAQRHSGAYLFMPDYDAPEKDILSQYSNRNSPQGENIIIVSGPVATEITTLYLPFLVHTIRIYNIDHPALTEAIYIENIIDFESPPKNRETELFMRIQTDIQNGEIPEFYTDQNGFQYQKRVKVDKLNIEGNYYPITTMAFMQDRESRLTLVTDHAQGAAAFEPGRIELMLDRRMLYDDFRGMGEGIVDNKVTLYQNWLILESITTDYRTKRDVTNPVRFRKARRVDEKPRRLFNSDSLEMSLYQLPSERANYLSRSMNYPVHVFIFDETEGKDKILKTHHAFVNNFPSGIHILNLRTMTDDTLEQFPSSSALLVLQRPGSTCLIKGAKKTLAENFSINAAFPGLKIRNVTSVSLTGLHTLATLAGLQNIHVEPMEVKTFMITF